MDPTAALEQFYRAMMAAEADGVTNDEEIARLWDAVHSATALFSWLAKGGFAPNWTAARVGLG